MSLSMGAPELGQLAAPVTGVAWLVELDFASGTQYLTTSSVKVDWGGHTYIALGSLAAVGNISESEAAGTEAIKLSLSLADPAMLAATLGNVEGYRGRAVRCRLALFNAAMALVGTPRLRFAGVMNPIRVPRKGTGGSIDMACSRAGIARSRNLAGLRLSDAQQQLIYPGDVGLQYIQSLIDTPALWLSKEFQKR